MADAKKEAVEEAPKKSKLGLFENKAILLGIIVVVQVGLAFGLTQFVIVPKLGVQGAAVTEEEAQAEKDATMPEMGVLVGLNEIIVTLKSTPHQPRYLRINVDLEVKNQVTADIVTSRIPQLRDIVIMTLSGRTAEDLNSAEGRKEIRDEIFRKIDAHFPDGTLMNIYFSDLVVQ